jgi:hypothetical protein
MWPNPEGLKADNAREPTEAEEVAKRFQADILMYKWEDGRCPHILLSQTLFFENSS